MVSFTDLIIRLENMGLTDVLLPFVLIFAIVFAVLQRAMLFGEKRKNINVIVSLVIALLVVVPHVTGGYPVNADPVEIMNTAIPNVSLVIVGVIMLMILVGVFGVNVNIAGKSLGGIVALLSFAVIVFIFGKAAGWFNTSLPPMFGFLNDPDTQALLLVLLVFGLIIWFVTGDDSEGADVGKGIMGFFENIGQALEHKK